MGRELTIGLDFSDFQLELPRSAKGPTVQIKTAPEGAAFDYLFIVKLSFVLLIRLILKGRSRKARQRLGLEQHLLGPVSPH